jgi:hypothetical protein
VKGRSHHLAVTLRMSGVDRAEVSWRHHDELGDAYALRRRPAAAPNICNCFGDV